MDYAKFDRSGTEDDVSLHRINWNARGAQFSGAMRVPSGTVPHGADLTDMEFQIHSIETEAYSAVLRAFIAQSDVLTWGKEGLISDLRKELRVSDVEHRELLVKVDSDDSVRMIREWRKGTVNQQGFISTASTAGYTSHKKLKTAHITVSPSPRYLPSSQPSPAVIPSPLATRLREEQWRDDAALIPNQGNAGQAMKSVADGREVLHLVGRGSLIVKSRKSFLPSSADNVKKGSDWIEIRATNKLIHEVERICGVKNPDPALVDQAKLILKEQERALLEALEKLADVPDGDDSPIRFRHCYSNEEPQINGYRTADRAICVHADHDRDYSARAGIPCIDLRGEDGNDGR